MELHYYRSNITHEPFANPIIRKILDKYINQKLWDTDGMGVMLDPFAREAFTNAYPNFITNDLNPTFDTDYNLEFHDFIKAIGDKVWGIVDLVLFDPPYSLNQLKMQYDGVGKDLKQWQSHNMWGAGLDELAKMMPPSSIFISLGWHSQGMGRKRNFEKLAVYTFEQMAREGQYNIFVTVEMKMQSLLDFVNDHPDYGEE
jgi:hypothetical protein